MNKLIINIVAVLLMVIIPTSVFGVEIHHHFCDSTKVHLVSLFKNTECSTELKQTRYDSNQDSIEEKASCCIDNESVAVEQPAIEENQVSSCCAAEKDEVSENNNFQETNSNTNDDSILSLSQKSCCTNFTERVAVDDDFEFASPVKFFNTNDFVCNIELTSITTYSNQFVKTNLLLKPKIIPDISPTNNQIRYVGRFCINKSGEDNIIS